MMRRAAGFTLPEVLIACLLLALLTVMAHRAFNAVAQTQEQIETERRYWQELENLFDRLALDLRHLDPITANKHVTGQPASVTNSDPVLLTLQVVRGHETGNREKVAYQMKGQELSWLTWDTPSNSVTAKSQLLLNNVESFWIDYLGDDQVWRDSWPPQAGSGRLQALRVTLSTTRHEQYSRIFALP